MKQLLALLLLIAPLALTSCNNFAVSLVPKATAQAPIVVHGEGSCPGGLIGCVIQESPRHYLAIRLGPQAMQPSQFVYTLPYDLDISLIDGWIGTAAGTQPLEAESRLQIQYPDGAWEEFLIETDKHTDVQGEKQRLFPISRHLPQGTSLIVHQFGGWTTVQSCLTTPCQDSIWRLYAK
jgi:hypothetical protein